MMTTTMMMRKRLGTAMLALFGLSTLAVAARAGDEKVAFDKLPEAVRKAVEKAFPKAEIEGASKEVEHGDTIYEVKLEIEDRPVEVALKADGTIVEIEKEVRVHDLPKAVKKALAAKFPRAKIEKAEEITKGHNGPVHYEVAIKAEVLLTAEGQIVKNKKEKDEDEDEDDDHEKGGAKARKGEEHRSVRDKEDHEKKSSAKVKKAKKHGEDKDDDDDDDDDDEHEKGKKKKGDKD